MKTTYTPLTSKARTRQGRMRRTRVSAAIRQRRHGLLDRGRQLTARKVSEKDEKRFVQAESDSRIRARIHKAFERLINTKEDAEKVHFEALYKRFRSCRRIVKFDADMGQAYVQVRSCNMGKACPCCSRKLLGERRDEIAYVLDTATKATHQKFYYSFATLTLDDKKIGINPRDGRGKLDFVRRELRKWKDRNRARILGSISKIEWTINKRNKRVNLHVHLILATRLRLDVEELLNNWQHGFTHFRKLQVDASKTAVEFASGVATYINKALDEGHSIADIATTIDLAYHKRTRLFAYTGFFSQLRANYNDVKQKHKEKAQKEIPAPPKPPEVHDLPSGTYNIKMLCEAVVAFDSRTARWLYETYLYREKWSNWYEKKQEYNQIE